MPSEVGITLGILQALYDQPIALPKFHSTTLSQGRTLLHDLLVSLPIGGQGDVLLLYGDISHDFLSLLDLVCMQGHTAGKQLGYPFFFQAVSTMYSITSSTGCAPLESGLSGEVLKVGVHFPMRSYTLIAEVVEVFAHPKGSHLANGVARKAHPPIERRLLLAFSRGSRELIGRADAEDLTDGQAGFYIALFVLDWEMVPT
jgi:hypothetical protein